MPPFVPNWVCPKDKLGFHCVKKGENLGLSWGRPKSNRTEKYVYVPFACLSFNANQRKLTQIGSNKPRDKKASEIFLHSRRGRQRNGQGLVFCLPFRQKFASNLGESAFFSPNKGTTNLGRVFCFLHFPFFCLEKGQELLFLPFKKAKM